MFYDAEGVAAPALPDICQLMDNGNDFDWNMAGEEDMMMDDVPEEEVLTAEQLLLKQSRKRSDSPWLCDSKETLAEMEER